MNRMQVKDIGGLLKPLQTVHPDHRSWLSALQTGWMQRGAGEIRDEPDVGWVPRDQMIEVAFAQDDKGPVLRWISQSPNSPARAAGFSALSHIAGEAPPTAHGYITVKSDGTMVVHQEPPPPPFDVAQYGWQLATPFHSNAQSRITWADALRQGSARQILGEIRTAEDLAKVPRGIALRAVYVQDGGAGHIRWANSNQMHTILGGGAHDQMWCWGDTVKPIRQGYLTVNHDGSVTVRGS